MYTRFFSSVPRFGCNISIIIIVMACVLRVSKRWEHNHPMAMMCYSESRLLRHRNTRSSYKLFVLLITIICTARRIFLCGVYCFLNIFHKITYLAYGEKRVHIKNIVYLRYTSYIYVFRSPSSSSYKMCATHRCSFFAYLHVFHTDVNIMYRNAFDVYQT